MKKLKRISLRSGIQVLEAMEMKQITGSEDVDPNVCHTKTTRSTCHGYCVDYEGYSGTCNWVNAESCCKCTVVYIPYVKPVK